MQVPLRLSVSKASKLHLLAVAVAAALFPAVLATGAGLCPAQESRPVTVFVHGVEVACDIPPLVMNERVFMPDQFVYNILGYPFIWEPKTRSMRIGVPQSGVDMVRELPAYTGKTLAGGIKVKAVSYPSGYAIEGKDAVRWSLHGVMDRVTFSFGMPDGHREKSVGFQLLADGVVIAEETVSKEEGLKEFDFPVNKVKVLTVKSHDRPGGVLVNPRGYQT